MWPMLVLKREGWAACGEMWAGRQEEIDRKWQCSSLIPPPLGCSWRGKSSLITEGCQSAVGEDDGVIPHFPCVFFIRPVLFLFQVLGKENRSWA